MDITLSAEQQYLLKVMEETHQHLFITGRAGAGKSVLLRHFRETTKKKVVIAAPTGIAALNVRGQTLHSLFKLAPQLHRHGNLTPNNRAAMLLKRIDTLVIDEISMVRADLLDAVDERLREATRKDMPFGGVQVIMFGDVYQLPPVVEEGLMPYFEAVHQGYFFFNALVWRQAEFKIYELTQVFRQKDPIFKDILNAVRDGSFIDSQLAQLNARHGIPIPLEGTVTLAPTNALVTEINQRKLDQLEGKAYEYKAIITGEMKRSTFPTEEVIQLKVGAQVVLLQNDKDKRWVNGTVATIAKLKKDDKEQGITVHVDGIDYDLETTTWEEIRYEYDHAEGKVKEEVVSSFTQYPIRLAWALTIHKSQGQTYESVALDLTTATFAPGQLYVALSRCTSLEGLYLKMPVLRKHIIVEPKVTAFMARRETITVDVVVEDDEVLAVPELLDVDAMLSDVMTEEKQATPQFTFLLQEKDNLVVAVDLSAKNEHPGAVGFAQVYTTYDAIGCRHGADRSQVGPMAIAQFEVNSYPQVDEMVARRIHPELFGYLYEKYGWLSPLVDRTNTRGDIKLGDRVVITYLSQYVAQRDEYRGVVKRIDTNGVASGDDCYLVLLDSGSRDYFCEGDYHLRPEVQEEAPQPRKRGPKGETKKKDFRFPVRLLEALKAAADEDGMSDTEFLMSLLKSDKRIQKKLFEDNHEQADFYVEEEGATK
jgi:ATP-dependent DNA helicase PIF1